MPGARICNLYSRPDYDGFGFSMRANERGPHQISSVEPGSPAYDAGLRVEDLILRVNDQSVVGERYSKTVTLIKNESERGRLKLEVIDPQQCPASVRDTMLVAPSNYSTIASSKSNMRKADSTQNLKQIAREARGPVDDRTRAVSVDAVQMRQRPQSMSDMNMQDTIRSTRSQASGISQRMCLLYIFLTFLVRFIVGQVCEIMI